MHTEGAGRPKKTRDGILCVAFHKKPKFPPRARTNERENEGERKKILKTLLLEIEKTFRTLRACREA